MVLTKFNVSNIFSYTYTSGKLDGHKYCIHGQIRYRPSNITIRYVLESTPSKWRLEKRLYNTLLDIIIIYSTYK